MSESLCFRIGDQAFFLDPALEAVSHEWKGLSAFLSKAPGSSGLTVSMKVGPFLPTGFRYRLLPDISLIIEETKKTASSMSLTLGCKKPIPVGVMLKIAAAIALPRVGGLFFHGALLQSTSEKNALLIGPSGSGKSTVAEQWLQQGGMCGSDEAVIVRPGKNEWLCYPTPFWGRLEPNIPALISGQPLHHVFLLKGKGLPDLIKCVFEADPKGNVASFQALSKFMKSYNLVPLPRKRVIMDRLNIIREHLLLSD